MLRFNLVIVSIASLLIFTSCEKSEEAEKLGEAQMCLDGIRANYQEADACIDGIMDIDSPQANILKCSATFLGGGLTTQRVKTAIVKLRDKTIENKELVFVAYLALQDQDRADRGAEYCLASGSRGLIYIASAVRLGTLFNLALPGGFTLTPDPAQLETLLTGGGLAASDETIGEIATTVVGSYCTESTKDKDICKEFQEAVESGSSNAEIGQLIRDRLTDKK